MRTLTFVAQSLRNPFRTASLVPSSRELASLMTVAIDPREGRVIELGGGTGVFTRALLDLGMAPSAIDVVELNPVFAAGLRRDFPGVRVLQIPAESIAETLASPAGPYQAVVSGLPLLAMRKTQQRAVLHAVFSLLPSGRSMYQFTYGPRRPVGPALLEELGLSGDRVATSWRNVPPARVFRFRRRIDA